MIQREIDVDKLPHYGLRQQIPIKNEITNNYVIINSLKTEQGVGSAFISVINRRQLMKKVKLSQNCTRFQALLIAIQTAFETLTKQMKSLNDITFVCEKSCVNALKEIHSKDLLINQIYEYYYKLHGNHINIYLCYEINDSQINEKLFLCKQLSEDAIHSHNRQVFDLMPIKSAKKKLKNKLINEWNIRWTEGTTGRHTFKYIGSVEERNKIEDKMLFNHKLTQVITNHGNFYSYLKRFGKKDIDSCDTCLGQTEDSDHKIFHCIKFDTQRHELQNKIERNGYNLSNVNHKSFLNKKIISFFIEFIQKII
jgi:hypothetical protein